MMRPVIVSLLLASTIFAASCVSRAADVDPQQVIALERAALERWGKGDPDGYLEIMTPDVSYFDPTTQTRLDGRDQVQALVEPFRGRLQIERAELLNPKVVAAGDGAILTFNLISHGGSIDGGPKRDARWNCTEVYRRVQGRWAIVHSHWSFTAPALSQP